MVKDVLKRAGLSSPDADLPDPVRVRHGQNRQGKLLHYYFNYSGHEQLVAYIRGNGSDVLTGDPAKHGQTLKLKPWDLTIIEDQ